MSNLNTSLYNNKRYNNPKDDEINLRKPEEKALYNTPKINKTYNIMNNKNYANQQNMSKQNKNQKMGYTNIY